MPLERDSEVKGDYAVDSRPEVKPPIVYPSHGVTHGGDKPTGLLEGC